MKLIPLAHELISNMRSIFQISDSDFKYLNEEQLRAELFTTEQMEEFGKTLAKTHKLSTKPAKDHLLTRLADNEIVLNKVRKLITDSIKRNEQITPASEWLIDNFYLIEENIRDAKKHLPKGYSENLPQLITTPTIRVTRIYDIVLRIISHSDGRIDLENLSSFVKAYQTETNLQLGELWAIPIMLRLALIENLSRISARIATCRVDRNLAAYWAQKMIETAENDHKNLILVIADMARSNPLMESAFVSELTRQLRGKGPELALALNWIDQQLSETGRTSAELVNAEIQKLTADQASISNSIGSLRLLGAFNWRDFVEDHSIVEQTLREDIDGIYGLMDFATRDRYRHAVEYIAKKSKTPELEVARIVVDLAKENRLENNSDSRFAHVGYYLVDEGVAKTERLAKMKRSPIEKMWPKSKKSKFMLYFFSIGFICLAISVGVLFKALTETQHGWLVAIIVFLSLLCTSQFAIALVNFFATLMVKPKLLSRMDFSKNIPSDYSTLIIVPVMLTGNDATEKLIEDLEVRFLANRKENLYFGLLTDFTDANQQTLPEDEGIITFAKERIEQLNEKYGRGSNDLFFLFHRPRFWNPHENTWMGYERKRGKLAELNDLLRGKSADRFSVIVGDQSVFQLIKYVITLDADTQLPLTTAWKLIGTMAHPLNHAWYDEKRKRVTKGYGILQPRVTVSLPETTSSLYTRMHGNEPGIDPYTRASSDVYQDLFDEGSFIGKGIYEVDIFKQVLEGRFSENKILSHDLLEGCYVRSGLLSDVQLFEKYPTSYRADMKRRLRWIRGDWQIFSWFLPWVPDSQKKWHVNPLSALSRWKIFDNIRRSLVPAALTILIILAFTILPDTLFWAIGITAIIIVPVLISSIWSTINKPKDVVFSHHIKNTINNLVDVVRNTLFMLICLPYEAFASLRVILLTIWRVFISKKNLLQWNPSVNEERYSKDSLLASYSFMWIEPFLAIVLAVYLQRYNAQELIIADPILFFWLLAPFVTWIISKPLAKEKSALTAQQYIFLRKSARKTWSFFEQFVGDLDNHLPPDNFQEQPIEAIAHRTSPTNIGLSLLANLTACDFGYITPTQLIERTTNTISTMEKMERYHGHFYNWYDTETLIPLLPKYISTVDSGNLAGHLMVLKQGLIALPHQNIVGHKSFQGIRDTLFVLADTLDEKQVSILKQFISDSKTSCKAHLSNPNEIKIHAELALKNIDEVYQKLNNDTETDTYWWKNILKNQVDALNKELEIFEPWFMLNKAPDKVKNFSPINPNASYIDVLNAAQVLLHQVNNDADTHATSENEWLTLFKQSLLNTIKKSEEKIAVIENLAQVCNGLADMNWDFLYNKSTNLFSIGYNAQEHHIDASSYDLLASEVRFCVFIGIAQGKLPQEAWFAMSRLLTNVKGETILLSWSGSMFEYLMPLLVMPTYENTLLDQTYKASVKWQVDYGKQKGVPWGISESGFNMINASSHYQYSPFGAPGLGLKRGLEEDLVIAPYATELALMVDPVTACKNLEVLAEKGFEGIHGFYEAIDYTPSRLQEGQSKAIVYSYMAHHKGMGLLSLAYLLLDQPMQELFEAEPQFKATLLLLQERIPKASAHYAHTTDIPDVNYMASGTETRTINTPDTALPQVQLLSNSNYHVMLTNAGGGYSRWKDLSLTRWREDGTRDNWGTFCYIRDLKTGKFWSNTHQPTLAKADKYEAVFSQGRADYRSSINDIETHTEIVVSPEDDIEIRRIHLTNCTDKRRSIEVTSYAEVVLAPQASDVIQPAFSNLFVQTEIAPNQHAILCTRRPRSADEKPPWMFHLMILHDKAHFALSYETDRMEFIGRGNSVANPQAMYNDGELSGNQGSVLDPVAAIRYKINMEAEETFTFDMITGVADTEEACKALIAKYQDKHHKDRVFEIAWTHSQVILRQINASAADAQLYARLAGSVLFLNSAFRPDAGVLIQNHRGQSDLWSYSISGDLPIVLLKIEKQANMQLVRQLIQAHGYWRLKGLVTDLVIWNEEHNVYRQDFQDDIHALIPPELKDRPGGIFLRASDQISNEDRILFQTVARINISDNGGTLADHIKRKSASKVAVPMLAPTEVYKPSADTIKLPENLTFFNGTGGFSEDGKEYVIVVNNKSKTPAPWVNVIANANFGTVISESGNAYTWMENAHEYRITPWNNDPVCDSGGEAFYIRDEDTGHFWSTTFLPAGGQSTYITKHGFGYSIFEHVEDGIHTEMTVYVDLESAVKFNVIKIKNLSGRTRNLSATGYVEWVLGTNSMKTAMHTHTEIDPDSGALFAKNPYNTEFPKRVGFIDVDYIKKSITADRTEFIGRNGSLKNPDAMYRAKLSGKIGLAMDPCGAIQVPFDIADGEEMEVIFRVGGGKNAHQATETAKKFRGKMAAKESLDRVKNYWKNTLGALQVETPDTAINILSNGWLTYQTLSSRFLGRTGFYQSGGAFGFRDQLQDMMSLFHAVPNLAREHILLCASRQFKEGDVQHWWHPPLGNGVRTRCSDDYLWLPFVTHLYCLRTGDYTVLDEPVPFLEGRSLNPEEESYYELPIQSRLSATLYEHCVRAIKHGFNYGERGLPLIGTGDWNDGFDRVGDKGKGESVWLGFFFYDILNNFSEIARLQNDAEFAETCITQAQQIKENIDKHAWDGEWYKRAWFDDGTPLGSSVNEECKIDSIAQSWSVLSGAGEAQRTQQAMQSAYVNLVQEKNGIIKLLDPPFDKLIVNPGYISGYVPGVRENGGQYTHAAIWLVMAFAKFGNNKLVWELLDMINPINRGNTSEKIATYKTEPYVVAADVYANKQHAGRGGWTWYTGSAGWMYRLITEYFLGVQQEGDKLKFIPCIPKEWESFKVQYRYKSATYHIAVTQKQGDGKMTLMVDGVMHDLMITLVDDEKEHQVEVVIYSGND